MPDDDLTATALARHLALSPLTVRRIIKRLRLKPRKVGTALLYTTTQAERIREFHAQHGGRWPNRQGATAAPR